MLKDDEMINDITFVILSVPTLGIRNSLLNIIMEDHDNICTARSTGFRNKTANVSCNKINYVLPNAA